MGHYFMMMLNNIYRLFFFIFFILYTNICTASENQLFDYYKTIRCLVCEGQSIQESDTEFAINLKEQIQKKYNSGMELKQINQELIKIYGEEISFKTDFISSTSSLELTLNLLSICSPLLGSAQ